MPTPALPEPIAAYFAADTQGPDAVARCFTPMGVVKDKCNTQADREAIKAIKDIKAWKAESSTLHTCTSAPFSVALIDGVHVVHSRPVGSFPGSPLDLGLAFRLVRGHVNGLEITA